MKRFSILLGAMLFPDLALAQSPLFPALTPIEEDPAVPDIAKAKAIYSRLTASDWRAESTLTAKVGKGYAGYPSADFFCKNVKGPTDIQFELSGKSPVGRITFLRIEQINCASVKQQGAVVQGLFVMDNGAVGSGVFRFLNKGVTVTSGISQEPQKQAAVFRIGSAGNSEIAAVAGSSGETLLTLEKEGLFKYNFIQFEAGNFEPISNPKVNARLIIPGLGYLDGRSSRAFAFEVGNGEPPGWDAAGTVNRAGWGYGTFYAIDDSFRITGPIFFDVQDLHSEYGKEFYDESKEPTTKRISLLKYLGAGSLNYVPVFYHPKSPTAAQKAQLHISSRDACVAEKGIRLTETCSPLFIETRVATKFGPPGRYRYSGKIDLNKGPTLDAMINLTTRNWRMAELTLVSLFPEKLGAEGYPTLENALKMATYTEDRLAKIFTRIDQAWEMDDTRRIQYLDARAKQFAENTAYLQAIRREDARNRAAGHAAIMGAIADIGASAQQSVYDMQQVRQQVSQTNAAAAGSPAPYVGAPKNAEVQRILAANWGRGGFVSSSANSESSISARRPRSAARSSGTESGSSEPTRKSITQQDAMQLMTGMIFRMDDGTTLATNGAYAEFQNLPQKQYPDWDPSMMPIKDMSVTRFDVNPTSGAFNLAGRGVCSFYQGTRDEKTGLPLVDQRTGLPYVNVGPCNWNFTWEPGLEGHFFSTTLFKGVHK